LGGTYRAWSAYHLSIQFRPNKGGNAGSVSSEVSSLKAALTALQPEFIRLMNSEDRREYFRSLPEHRAPVFVGR
jgi:hypothetical protein